MIFFIPGIPKPGGSKRAFINKKTGKAILTDASGKPGKDWRSDCKAFAVQEMDGRPLLEGPLLLVVCFCMPRPKCHFRVGKNSSNLKDSSPYFHTSRPDATKLLRSLEDALTGIVWKDDAEISAQFATKVFRDRPGASVLVIPTLYFDFKGKLYWAISEVMAKNSD